jgi:O-antigen ligase
MGVRGEPTTLRSIKRVDLFLGFFLVTLTVSTLASLFPLFSLKMLMNMYWYVTASYVFVKSRMSSQKQMNRMLAALMVIAGLASLYSLSRHAIVGFSRTSIPWAIEPFFKEHGSYSAFLSISFGISFSLAFGRGMPKGLRKIALWVTPLLVFGILFSFARGAWLGVFVYVLFFVLVHSREILKPGSFIVLLFFLTISTLAVVGFGIQSSLETNLESIGDVERNVSNLERFNRWVAAANMVEKFPFTGVGFGAYPDSYGRFRDRRFETPVSDFYGYPHNDYIQFLAEAGVFALLFWLCFLGTLFSAGLIGYFRIRDELDRRALVGCLGGILTYLVHAVFNDFLMVDKVAVPFWVCAAIVVAILGRNAEHVLGSSNTRSPETTRVSI